MIYKLIYVMLFVLAPTCVVAGPVTQSPDKGTESGGAVVQDSTVDIKLIQFETIIGDTVSLSDFTAKAILIVNVASKCGFTKQYAGLQQLYNTYSDSGLTILGFPANNFGDQEPGSDEEILNFCTTKFDVTFPMMSKVSVKGEDKHPLYKELTEHSGFSGEIEWNFTKFLLDSDGKIVARFGTRVDPMSEKLISEIKDLLR